MCNNDWVMADKWIFKIAAAAILDFVGSEILPQWQSRLTGIHLPTEFGEDIWKVGRITAIYVFPQWQPAAILDFHKVKFEKVSGFSLWAKFCLNMRNSDCVLAFKVNFQNGGRRHLGFNCLLGPPTMANWWSWVSPQISCWSDLLCWRYSSFNFLCATAYSQLLAGYWRNGWLAIVSVCLSGACPRMSARQPATGWRLVSKRRKLASWFLHHPRAWTF